MAGIFISYRRDDTAGYAQRLYQSISAQFGKKRVFIDIDKISPGDDFRMTVRERIAGSDAFLALIGPNWLRSRDEQGRRRLENPADYVRAEIVFAIQQKIRIIPVLLGGTPMPRPEELPVDMRPLVSHNAHEIPDLFFEASVRQLIKLLRSSVRGGLRPARRTVLLTAAGASVLAAGIELHSVLRDSSAKSLDSRNETGNTEDLPVIETPDHPGRVPVHIKEPVASPLPPGVPGPWKIDKTDFGKDVIGPRQPHLEWAADVTVGDQWKIAGFAPDGTVFVYDEEDDTICGVRDGMEIWAYRSAYGLYLQGLTSDGRVWLKGPTPAFLHDSVFAFNSRGEGGRVEPPAGIPQDLVRRSRSALDMPEYSHPFTQVDGSYSGVIRDDRGGFYVITDKATLYCFSPERVEKWKYRVGAPIRSAVFTDQDVMVGAGDRLCIRDGALRWDMPMVGCEPALADKAGATYVSYRARGSKDANAAVDGNGKVLWRIESLGTPHKLDPQGRLYLLTDRRLVCLA